MKGTVLQNVIRYEKRISTELPLNLLQIVYIIHNNIYFLFINENRKYIVFFDDTVICDKCFLKQYLNSWMHIILKNHISLGK